MSAGAFRVVTDVVTVAVEADGERVTRIVFEGPAERDAATPFERRVAAELEAYGAGEATSFSFAIAPEGTPFQRAVWAELGRIPYGETRSYGNVAKALGRPGAARAVGAANHRNPIPLAIPCHRVVAADGSLAGFGGGVELKRRLLAMESRHPAAGTMRRP